mmetsp:Transcript_83617/g.241495  ORF Transcript_83617/g.241495 Transcript_83617/m.241495 type:complete len:229 (+) Transcript_83617:156-842(+)
MALAVKWFASGLARVALKLRAAARARGGLRDREPAGVEAVLGGDAGLLVAALCRCNELHRAPAAAGDADGPREEHTPTAPRSLAVDLHDRVLFALPQLAPSVEGARIVIAHVVHVLNLEPRLLEMGNHPTHRARGVCAGENMFIHKEAPHEVLIVVVPLGVAPGQARNLQVEDPVVRQQRVHLAQECVVVPNADVLRHLDGGDHVVRFRGVVQLEKILQHDVHLVSLA